MNISMPDPMRDYVQDRVDSGHYGSASDDIRALIRRDQDSVEDEARWLRELDASLAERDAGGGTDIDTAFAAVSAAMGWVMSPWTDEGRAGAAGRRRPVRHQPLHRPRQPGTRPHLSG